MTITDAARYWAAVPAVDADEPDPAGPDLGLTVRKASSSLGKMKPSRRTMFKSAGALGGALAINILSSLPPGRGTTASAETGTEYTSCAGYDSSDGYDDNTKVCVGAPYARSHCGSDGWFRRGSGTCWNSYPTKACGSGPRNAWRWTHNGTRYRCADGYVASCGGTVFRICSWSNP
ncbi:MAG TPA: hypothetical protein VFG33_02950 [Kribbella sp.]|uniref:hypothetical protein n=1 Tax=Kribbella sp. TaxID=1871183 RepID=UPI002D7665CE|nr:hypothetical protein [Kribbella sp.]HET6292297.1 hypothetical protein [Kribbella sp.]